MVNRCLDWGQALALVALVVIGLTPNGRSWANGPEVIVTGAVLVPVQSATVQLRRESVDVCLPNLEGIGGHVECSYVLKNPGPTQVSFSMAFVTGNPQENVSDIARTFTHSKFRVVADGGVELRPTLQATEPASWRAFVPEPPESLLVWDVVIPAGETKRLDISYEIWWSSRTDGDKEWFFFRYNARPAILWSGPIGVAEINFRIGDLGGTLLRYILDEGGCAPAEISPAGYQWSESGINWKFWNWEPDCDFEISVPRLPVAEK